MKQRTKKTASLLALILASLSLIYSCQDESSDPQYHTYGLAYPVADREYSFKIVSDGGKTLIPSNSNYTVDSVRRVYTNFSFINQDDVSEDIVDVKFNLINNILYKGITNQDTSLGDDPVYVRKNEVWHSTTNNILNIPFQLSGGNEIHLLHLYYNPIKSVTDTMVLEFRHNANMDPYESLISGLVSFDLNTIEDNVTVTDSLIYKVSFNRGSTSVYAKEWFGIYKPLE